MLKPYTTDKYLLRELVKMGNEKVNVSSTELSHILKVNKLTINRALIRLESAGYIERCGRTVWRVLKDENSD